MGLSLTDGFEHYYHPNPQHLRDSFHHAVIVLDTNVLLNVLRYSPLAREELLGVIDSIADRCFVPHQVALEFNRNRVNVVTDRLKELNEASQEISELRTKIRGIVNRLRNRRIIPIAEAEELDDLANEVVRKLQDAADDALTEYDLDPAKLAGKIDQWTKRLSESLAGKVGKRPADATLEEYRKEADRRRAESLAPGFKDKAGGDYMWWAEVLDRPELKAKPLFVVSDDAAKGDWRFEQHGIAIGPHAILLRDVENAGGSELFLLTTRDLLQLVEDVGSTPVSESTIAESEEVLSSRRTDWTLEGYVSLINMLETDGYDMRAKVIRAAAESGGYLERDAVYKIAGIAEAERSLRQFATPVQRLTQQLIDEGSVGEEALSALTAEYERPGKASGYSVPEEFVGYERILQDSEAVIEDEATADWTIRDQARARMRSIIKRIALSSGTYDDAGRVAEILVARAEARVGTDSTEVKP